jgi:hypothetical protein
MDQKIDQIMNTVMMQALSRAMDEVAKTPLLPGTMVGNIQIELYGTEPGELVSYNSDGTLTIRQKGQTVIWPALGTVDIARVDVLMEEEYAIVVEHIVVEQVNLIKKIVSLIDEKSGRGLPTPGCDCEYCLSCSPEEHALAQQEAAASGFFINKDDREAYTAAAVGGAASSNPPITSDTKMTAEEYSRISGLLSKNFE